MLRDVCTTHLFIKEDNLFAMSKSPKPWWPLLVLGIVGKLSMNSGAPNGLGVFRPKVQIWLNIEQFLQRKLKIMKIKYFKESGASSFGNLGKPFTSGIS